MQPSSEGAEHSKMFVAFLLLLKFLPKGSRNDTALMYSGPIISNHWSFVLVATPHPVAAVIRLSPFPEERSVVSSASDSELKDCSSSSWPFPRLSHPMEIILCGAFCERAGFFLSEEN